MELSEVDRGRADLLVELVARSDAHTKGQPVQNVAWGSR